MKRAHLTALAAGLLALTACSGQAVSKDAGASDLDPGRFTTLWGEAGDNLQLPGGQTYNDSSDANRVHHLTGDSPVHFEAYYFPTRTRGYWCATSDDDTFVTEVLDGKKHLVLMGDGGCSVDTADAAVIGDYRSQTWTKGADLMEGEHMDPWGTRTTTLPVQPHPDVLDAAAAVNLAVMEEFARTGAIPAEGRLTRALANSGTVLPADVRADGYIVVSASKAQFMFCSVNDRTGDWAWFDSTQGGIVSSGANATNFDEVCTAP